jgi:hypothetical protein
MFANLLQTNKSVVEFVPNFKLFCVLTAITERTFLVQTFSTESRIQGQPAAVTQIQFNDWPEREVAENVNKLIDLHKIIGQHKKRISDNNTFYELVFFNPKHFDILLYSL